MLLRPAQILGYKGIKGCQPHYAPEACISRHQF